MYGFKSFSNKTEFSFSPGITAFVGPNGCGKSNVVDAIRWVLGEQNPRVLRANKMEDLIYAGTEQSQHKNYAEVSIVLDNNKQEIPLDYREITVTRRYYRSGDSEYFLNRVPCRLKDINELLASTSLGRGTYAIIGQGQVEEVINSRPEDRRLMFEEAAGVALYKLRKREALKKLGDTRVNLTRIADIVNELQSQEEEIRESAVRAEEYLELKEQADKLALAHWAGRYLDLRKRLEKLEEQKLELENSKIQGQARLDSLERQLATITVKLQECLDVIAALERNQAQLGGNKTQLEYQLQLAEQRQLDYQNMVVQGQQELTRLQAELEAAAAGLTRVEMEISGVTNQIGAFSAALKRRSTAAGLLRRLLAAAEHYRSKSDDLILQTALAGNEFTATRDKARQSEAVLTGQLDSVRQELAGWKVDEATIQEELTRFSGELAGLAGKGKELSASVVKMLAELDVLDNLRKAQAAKIAGLEREHTILAQKIDLLKDMEEDLQGFSPGTRSALKASRDKRLQGIHGAVAELIQVRDPAHSLAIEMALGGALNYVICTDEESCRRAIEMLKKTGGGRATFVPVTAAGQRGKMHRPGNIRQPLVGWADQLVDCAEELKPVASMLLGNVLVTANLAEATKLAIELHYRYKIVTLEGEVISRGFFTGGSSGRAQQGLLQRKASINELSLQLVRQNQVLKDLKTDLKKTEEKYQALQEKQQQAQADREAVEKELFRVQTQAEQARVRQAQTKARVAECSERLDRLEENIQQVRRVLDSLSSRIDLDTAGLEKLKGNKDQFQDKEEMLRDMVSIWASRQNSLQLTIYSLQNQVDSGERRSKQLQGQKRDLHQRLTAVAEETAKKEELKQALQEKLEQTHFALTEIAQGLQTVAASLDGQGNARGQLKREIEAANKEIASIREDLEATNTSLHEAEVRRARWQAEEEGLVRELGTQFGLDPEQGTNHFDRRYTINELAARLKKSRGRMEEMGEINLAAIPQHKKLVQRLQFLQGQQNDLIQAEEDILGLVGELDQSIRELFMETFEKIQQYFAEIFKVLFAGGSAYLALSDQEDLLETGIEIYARPPGKRMQSLSLLSGGEKAMTAIALLFALQSVRPSPFCILDEIEAALDEVNIVRFADYLCRLAEGMQFILITHRREIMERADSLYGITSGSDGASKPISVALTKERQRTKEV